MRYCCCVLGCSNTSNDGVKLHEFPFDNQSLLPVWIMATNRADWLPVVQSRICDKHFSIDDYEGGDKNNKLKPNACPMFNAPNNNVEDSITITDSSDTSCFEISSTSGVNNISDIDSDEFPDTPNTSDMKSDDSTISSLSDSTSNEATGLDDDFLSSLSENGFDAENIDVDQPSQEFDTVSLSSSSTNFETTDQITNERCAVVLCNEKIRQFFDRLFFIDFPKNQSLRNIWWTLCGRHGKFDPSLKVCSIHFDVQDFIIVRREGIHYQQALLKTNNIVPTLYLLPHEFNTFKKKQKPNNRKRTSNNFTEIIKCTVKGCKKTFLNDGKRTLFFKFPLKNKYLLKDWVSRIGLPNWQPSETDRLCSDHFENSFIVKIKDTYELNKYAVPSIKPKNPFSINSGDLNKTKNSVFNDSHDSSFNCLEFNKLNSNTLMVKDRKRRKVEDKESDLLDPLQNNIETHQRKAKKTVPAETTIQMKTVDESVVQENKNPPTKCNKTNHECVDIDNLDDIENLKLQAKGNSTTSLTKQYLESFEREIAKEKEVVNQNSFNPIDDLEYIYLDVLVGENVVEEQPLNNANNSLKNDRSKPELGSTSNINNLKNRIEVDPKVNTNSVSPKPSYTSKGTKKSKVESTDNTVLEGTNLIPISKNNGNERDYVYLDMLNGDEFKKFLSFEKKATPKYAKKKIPELMEKIQPKGIPESILNNQDLTECYGEILPPWCSSGCQLKCYHSIPGPQRTEIYKEFQKLTSITEQNCKIVELVKLRTIKKVDSTFESIPSYCLMMNKATVNVCRTFFMNTLGITEQRLNAVLIPVNYSWFSNKDAVLRANLQKSARVINKSSNTTDFVKESLKLLEKDYNLHEPESDSEVSLDNVPADEYEKVFVYMKGVPRVLSSYQKPGDTEKHFFETTICFEYMYKTYSENYIKNKTPPPYSKRQFKKIYNQYMKTFLKMV